MKYLLVVTLLLGISLVVPDTRAQVVPYKWETVLELPSVLGRYNDIDFVDDRHGWTIVPYFSYLDTVRTVGDYGQIYRTGDGGSTWEKLVDSSHVHFRAIQFKDRLNGWVGSFGVYRANADSMQLMDTIPLFSTSDGGDSWHPVTTITGEKPAGICGLQLLDDMHIFGCGRFAGPGSFIKSTDGGATWHSRNISHLMEMAIDCYFWTPDSGIIAGGSDFSMGAYPDMYDSTNCVVILTTDGGETWREIYRSNRTIEWCWKIHFPSRSTGYISIETVREDSLSILKTTDGGLTWERKLVHIGAVNVQGIGFLNDSLGFIGGRTPFGYRTTDGGNTWKSWNTSVFSGGANRFRFIGDTVGFVVGKTVAKLTTEKLSIDEALTTESDPRVVYRNGDPYIDLNINGSLTANYSIIDVAGRVLYRSAVEQVNQPNAMLKLPSQLPFSGNFVQLRVNDRDYLLKL